MLAYHIGLADIVDFASEAKTESRRRCEEIRQPPHAMHSSTLKHSIVVEPTVTFPTTKALFPAATLRRYSYRRHLTRWHSSSDGSSTPREERPRASSETHCAADTSTALPAWPSTAGERGSARGSGGKRRP